MNVVQHELENIWYLDSGCNNHMRENNKIFMELDNSVTSQVKLGNRKMQNIEGKGLIVS